MQKETALQLAADGNAIFPCSAQDKRPLPRGNWREHATTDAETIELWWNEWPDALPAIALPPDVVVVDIDPRNGGFETCNDLDLPDTRSVTTAGGGAHLYYQLPAGVEVKNGPLYHAEGYAEKKGVDLKTSGGYVIAPGVARADGKRYELARDLPLAPCPPWIIMARGRNIGPSGKTEAAAVQPPMILKVGAELESAMTPALAAMLAPRLAAKGQRHEVARAVGGALAASGWSDDAIAGLVGRLPSTDPRARVADALQAAARYRSGEPTPGFGALERAGYAGGVVRALATMAGGGIYEELSASAADRAGVELVESLTAAGGAGKSDAFGKILTLDDIAAPILPVNWLCEALNIAPGPPTLFAGYGGLGKSMLVQTLIVCAASGRPLFQSMPIRQSRVLHFDFEQGARLTRTRYQRIAADLGMRGDELSRSLDILSPPTVNLETSGIEEGLTVMCQGYDLVVIDSLRASVPAIDENSSEMRKPLDMLFRVSERTGCVFIVIHHARKADKESKGNQEMRGSSAINDGSQTVIMLEAAPMKDGKPAFQGFNVSPGKIRDGKKFQPFGVAIEDVPIEGVPFDALRLHIVDADKRTTELQAELEAGDDAIVLSKITTAPAGVFKGGASGLSDLLPIPRDRVRRSLARLREAGKVVEDAGRALIAKGSTP
jgi:hypothetical protein